MSLSDSIIKAFAGKDIHVDDQGIEMAPWYVSGSKKVFCFGLNTYPDYQTAALWNFQVEPCMRGKNLGRLAMHWIAKDLITQGVEELELMMVRNDGLSFWPYLGAEPNQLDMLPCYASLLCFKIIGKKFF